MSWCPKCKLEYREGFKICSDCNSELVDQLEETPVNDTDYDEEAFLATVSGSIEADMAEELLNSNRIPVLKKHREAGEFLTVFAGASNFGVDLFVPSKLLEKAKEIFESCNAGVFVEDNQIDYIEEETVDKEDKTDIIDADDTIEEE